MNMNYVKGKMFGLSYWGNGIMCIFVEQKIDSFGAL